MSFFNAVIPPAFQETTQWLLDGLTPNPSNGVSWGAAGVVAAVAGGVILGGIHALRAPAVHDLSDEQVDTLTTGAEQHLQNAHELGMMLDTVTQSDEQ